MKKREFEVENNVFEIYYFDDESVIKSISDLASYRAINVSFTPKKLMSESIAIEMIDRNEDLIINEFRKVINDFPNVYNHFEFEYNLVGRSSSLGKAGNNWYLTNIEVRIQIKLKKGIN